MKVQIQMDGIYAMPTERLREKLWRQLLVKYGTVKNVAKQFNLSQRQLYKWKEAKNNYPLKVLNNICNDVGLELESGIQLIKTEKASDEIRNPKMRISINGVLMEFFGHLLFDGGIDARRRVHYTTHSQKLAERFQYLTREVFGDVKFYVKQSKRKTAIFTTATLGRILEGTFGCKRGSKVMNNVGVPEILKRQGRGDEDIVSLWRFVSAAYVCDGVSDRVAIISCSANPNKTPMLLEDLRTLLEKTGIRTVKIKPSSLYETKSGTHRRWALRVQDKEERKLFLSKVELPFGLNIHRRVQE